MVGFEDGKGNGGLAKGVLEAVDSVNGEIANAASEQTNAAQHINQGVNVITDLCVSNIDVAQDAANQRHTLSALATQMHQVVGQFHT